MLKRIFVAINLDEQAKDWLSECAGAHSELPARWTSRDNLHLTLLFLGNTPEKELEVLENTLQDSAKTHKAFSLSIEGIAYGPSRSNPRMVWAKIAKSQELELLQKDMEKRVGTKEARPFSPHITLARLRPWNGEAEELPLLDEELDIRSPAESIDIMESKLSPKGAIYTLIERIPLQP